MKKLLRASTFCRPLFSPVVEVSMELLSEKGFDSNVFGSVELLVHISVKEGDLVWLESEKVRIPAVLRIEDDMTDIKSLKVPPTLDYLGSKKCRIRACTGDMKPPPQSVTVRPVGEPVNLNFLHEDRRSITEYPNIGSQSRLLASSSLITILSVDKLFVYEVLNLSPDGPCWTHSETEWILEACPGGAAVPRLPPLDRTTQYLKNEQYQPEPHPSLNRVYNALNINADAPASHKIVHIVGSLENHVDTCVEKSAYMVGRRYMKVNGLAAFGHASGRMVTTGSTQDKMAGCEVALQYAHRCAPCVLHLVNFEDELPSDDEPLRHMLEMRLWTMLTTALRLKSLSASVPKSHVPPVIVVLSTRKAFTSGFLMRKMVFAPIIIQEPDEAYARFLWNDDESFEKGAPYLVGKTALEVRRCRRQWLHTSLDVTTFLQGQSKPQSQNMSQIPNVHWDDIGGLGHVRKEVMDGIELPLQHPELFRGTRRSGILLYGPPGTGKTLIAKAVATECGLPFFSVKGPELLGSYVGESEANVRLIFAIAREVAVKDRAAVLFFDELDSLAPRRGGLGDGGGVMDRVVATLLTELDEDDTVFFIGATNRPDLLDPSLLRPGRLDRKVYLGVLTEHRQRAQLLAALIRKFKLELVDPMEVALNVVGKLPPNLSGADFSGIASAALMLSLKRFCGKIEHEVTLTKSINDILDEWEDLTPVVTTLDLLAASRYVVPSITVEDHRRYQELRQEFSS